MSMFTRSVSAVCLIFGFTSVQAATTAYFSQADFLSALGGATPITYDFEGEMAGSIISSGYNFGGAVITYSLADGSIITVDDTFDTTSPNNYLATDDATGGFVTGGAFLGGDEFTITFNQSLQAVGLYVISADVILDDDFTLSTNGGQSIMSVAVPDLTLTDGDAYYIGLIEDDFNLAFNSITLSSADFGFLFNVDDITVAAVPLPASAWLFMSGFALLFARSRKIASREES